MPQKITTTLTLEMPEDKVLIDKAEYIELKEEQDTARWWTAKDLKERYNHNLDWFKERCLLVPKWQDELKDFVNKPENSGKNIWEFEPAKFKKFMSDHFQEIHERRN
ncbi:DUF771 domain-containing protein [Lactobacillus terrae]|uniref:DUF771 domain-containing protein n=1 Tax=Lactobacillus terrae TaxID=2269374 RepID=UPI000C1B7325|nr:DUF771 domain-containing protein [Lactobacillus terrae]